MLDNGMAERIHKRINETHKLIIEVKLIHAENKQTMKHLEDDLKAFIIKVDNSIFDTEKGFIITAKTKFSSIFTQLKSQWFLITILLIGILGITWGVLANK